MNKLMVVAVKTAMVAALLGSLSIANAQSGGSGSAGATIDTGAGAAAAGASAALNPGLANGAGGPVALLVTAFCPAGPEGCKADRQPDAE